tara:strand:- start:35910 stop:36215 length:306 start_codon:yes stop_codon:yes gene_type:complete
MAATVTAWNIGRDWVDLNTLSGIAAGTEILLQNTGLPHDVIQAAISVSTPPSDFQGVLMKQLAPMYKVTEGEGTVWVRLYRFDREFDELDTTTAPLQVQVI